VTPPEVVTHVDAVYPRGVEGDHADVVLVVTVDATGRVDKVEVSQSGGAKLDEAAIVAVRQWTFKPAMRGDVPVASRIKVPFHFAPPAPPPDVIAPAPGEHDTVAGGVSPERPAKPAPPPPPPVPAPPEQVRVVGRAQAPSRGTSDFQLRLGELGRVPRANAAELLKLAPGILLTNEGGEGHAEQIFLRGFDAREGQDIEISVGGVPVNEAGNLHGNGFADTHFVIPELVESLRVVEGPFDPRQGNFAVAGSAEYELGLKKRGMTARITTGSFGSQRMLLLWGPEGESTHSFAGGEIYKTDGYGQNRDARRGSMMAQHEGRIGDTGTWRLFAQAYATSYHSAGVVRDDDVRAGRVDFYGTYDAGQGGDSSRYSVAAEVETKRGATTFRNQVFVIARSMRLRENFTGFLLDPQTPLQSPHGQRGDRLDLSVTEHTLGARGFARTKGTLFDLPQEVEFGYFARGDESDGTQQRVEAATGHPYHTDTDLGAKLGDVGLYADANVHLAKWLALRGGVRADVLTFDVLDRCAVQSVAHPSPSSPPGDASCLSQQDFGRYREPTQRATSAATALLPRASALVGPFEGFTMSASYGQGVRSVDPIYVTQDVATPFASVKAYEGGVSYAGGTEDLEIGARSLFFQTHVDRDLVFSETAGRNTLGGGTTRTGWVGAGRVTGRFFDVASNVTFVKSTLDDTHLLVPYAPDVVVRTDASVFGPLPFELAGDAFRGAASTGVTYVGHRALPYGQRSDAIFTIDAQSSLEWRRYEVGLAVTNLLDRRYRLGEYNYASDFRTQSSPTLVPSRHFSAGAPRAVFATFAITVGGEP
jgi:TonB family protein